MNKIMMILPLLCLGWSARAQKMESDSLKYLTEVRIVGDKAQSIPGSGQYIGLKKLSILNQTNVNNVLRGIPGVNVRDEEGFGLRPNIGLRGTPVNRSAKITLMEDGILIAPAPYSDPSAYYFPTFSRMQGVEVLKGSSQIKYGPYTIGGALNLISTEMPSSFKGFAQLSYGSFATNQQRIWIGDSRKNLDYVFEVNRLASNGFKQLDNGGRTGFDRRDFMGKLRWHSSSEAKIQHSLTLKMVNSSENGDEAYLGLTYNDFKANPLRRYAATQNDKLQLQHQLLSLTHAIQPIKGLSITTTGYSTRTFRDWSRVNSIGGQSITNILNDPLTHQTPYLIMTGNADGEVAMQGASRTYQSRGVQSTIQYHFQTKQIAHKIQWSARYHYDEADRYATKSTYKMQEGSLFLVTPGVNGNQENQLRTAQSAATYLNYELRYKNLTFTPGIRYENITFRLKDYGIADYERRAISLQSAKNNLSVVLPGIGVNYDINHEMNVFAGVHKGFSPPGVPSVTSTTGQAKSEEAMNYELGYRLYKNSIQVQAVGFLNQYANILGSDNVSGGGMGTGNMFNAGKALVGGLECNVEYNLLRILLPNAKQKLPIQLSYTYTHAKFMETFKNAGGDWGTGTITKGDLIPFITPHLLSAGIGYQTKKVSLSSNIRYVGITRIKPGQKEIVLPASDVEYTDVNAIGSFMILDVSANYHLNKMFTLFSTIGNLTNNKTMVTNLPQGYRPNMPLNFNLGVKAGF